MLKVNITDELVQRACQRDSRHCMIAEAIKLTRPDYKNILVDLQTIRWTNPRTGKRYICLTPEAAGQALVLFDRGEPVQPFTLNLKPAQVTSVVTREVQPDGSKRQRSSRGRRRLKIGDGGAPVIQGGKPLPPGHLRGTAGSGGASAERNRRHDEQSRIAAGDEGNVVLSSRRYRQYGLRLLKD